MHRAASAILPRALVIVMRVRVDALVGSSPPLPASLKFLRLIVTMESYGGSGSRMAVLQARRSLVVVNAGRLGVSVCCADCWCTALA